MIFSISSFSNLWAEVILRATVHGAIAIGIVLVIGFLFSKSMTSNTHCWLWRLVFVKLLLLVIITTPISVPILPGQVETSADERVIASVDSDSFIDSEKFPAGMPSSPATEIALHESGDWRTGESETGSCLADSPQDSAANSAALIWTWTSERVSLLFAIWLTGVLLSLGWLIKSWLIARKLRNSCEPIRDTRIHQQCRELCEHFGIRIQPQLSVSPVAISPLLVGNFNPMIVFPAKTIESLDDDQLQLVIAHELSHLKRRDLWWSWIPTVVQILLFFHPLVWAAKTRWLLSREMACDELVLAVTGRSATSYADALINVSSCMGRAGSNPIGGAAFGSTCMVQTSFSLKRRIQAMKNFTNYRSIPWHMAVAFGMTALLAVIPWQPVHRQVLAAVSAPESSATNAEVRTTADESNLDFEQTDDKGSPIGWFGGGMGYELTSSPNAHTGKSCGQIKFVGDAESKAFGTFTKGIKDEIGKYRGKRVRYSGFLKSDMEAEAWAGIWMRVDVESKPVAFDNMNSRPVKGDTQWTEYSVVLDVPAEATNINFGFLIAGEGTLWGDDLKIEIVDNSENGPAVTGGNANVLGAAGKARNLDFEEIGGNGSPKYWGGGGKGYKLTASPDAHLGKSCGKIQSIDGVDKRVFGTFTNRLDATDYLGKRVRYTGFLKSDLKDDGRAGLWMRVDGESGAVAFDNMNQRPVLGETGWTEYTVVLDVPAKATNINFGFLLSGEGTLWGDDLEFEIVGDAGKGPEVTDMIKKGGKAVPTNLGFESGAEQGTFTGWFGGGKGFKVTLDSKNARTGKGAVRMERVDDDGQFSGVSQQIAAKSYLGKKILLSGYIRTEETTAGGAGLWLRIDGANRNIVGFDNMAARPILGTTDWKRYEIEMEVADKALSITFGVLLKGGGIAWADDFAIDTVE